MVRGVKNRAGGTWTESRYFAFIRSNLRRAWSKYPVKFKVLNDAKRPYEGDDKRTKWEYQCSVCEGWFKSKEIEVDHINPAGSLKTYEDLAGFCERLFCEEDNLRVVCKGCHAKITAEERERKKK